MVEKLKRAWHEEICKGVFKMRNEQKGAEMMIYKFLKELVSFKDGKQYPVQCLWNIVTALGSQYSRKFDEFCFIEIESIYYQINKYSHIAELFIELKITFNKHEHIHKINPCSVEELVKNIECILEERMKGGKIFLERLR